MRPLICFTGIFKDEAKTIRKTLESVRDVIDGYCILDTGSTDDTKQIIKEVFASLPGTVYEEPFVDFATTRNRSLDLMATADDAAVFTLTLSADEVLDGGAKLRVELASRLEADDGGYAVTMANAGRTWPSVRVLRTDAKWRYAGDPHEIPEGPNHVRTGPLLPGVTITHTESDPERKHKRMRDYDLPRLQKRVADNVDKDPAEVATAIWWLAQTHDALAEAHPPHISGGPWLRHKLEAMALYYRRSQIGNPEIESDAEQCAYAYYASMMVADRLGFIYTNEELLGRLQIIVEACPAIVEAQHLLAVVAAKIDIRQGLPLAEKAADAARGALVRAATDPALRGTSSNLEWACLGLAAQCAMQIGRKDKAVQLAVRAIKAGGPKEKFAVFFGEEPAAAPAG
jgi:hypothetical protein